MVNILFEIFLLCLCVILLLAIIFIALFARRKAPKDSQIRTQRKKSRKYYNSRGFDNNHLHKNGTKYDDFGFDYYGYDVSGYNANGYTAYGRDKNNRYNRMFDTYAFRNNEFSEDRFRNPQIYPFSVSDHAKQRMAERVNITGFSMLDLAFDAYCYGKSSRQLKKSSAIYVKEIEDKYDDSVVLIYRNYIYIFSTDNVLKTVYKNDKIIL